MTVYTLIHLINLLQQSFIHILLIFNLLFHMVIKYKVVTFHRYRRKRIRMLFIPLLFLKFLYGKMMFLHILLIQNLNISIISHVGLNSSTKMNPWETITLKTINPLICMVMSAQVHWMISWLTIRPRFANI